jgi:periplasmic protein TonB
MRCDRLSSSKPATRFPRREASQVPYPQAPALLALRSNPQLNSRGVGLAVTIALHVALLAMVLSYAPVRRAMHEAAPIIVSLISAPPADKPVEPPKPLPMRATAKRVPQHPIVPVPLPVIVAPAPSTFATLVPDAATLSPEAPPTPAPVAPPPIVPPNFDAAYLDNPAPIYPPLARRSGEQGRVLLHVLVAAAGTAETVELRTSSGFPRLDQAAIETVKHWRFVAARQGDHAVAAWVLVPITFTLER